MKAVRARRIDYAVVLAFDNVYDPDGTYRGPKQPNPKDVLCKWMPSAQLIDFDNPHKRLGWPSANLHILKSYLDLSETNSLTSG